MEPRQAIYKPAPSIAEAMRQVRTKRQLADLLGYLRIRPAKSRGQSFLVDHNLLDFMVRTAEVGPEDLVLDIGCGTGLLTAHLAEAAGKVIGIELDRGLFAVCSRYLEGRGNVTLLCGDALASKHALSPALLDAVEQEWTSGRYKALRVVSNLPYSAASAIVPNLLESGLPLAILLVTVQKEVADRLAAAPGSRDYGALSLVVQAHAAVEIVRRVPPEVFWPRPKVTSSIVRLVPEGTRRAAIRDYAAFTAVVRAAFAHRRKTLANSMAAELPALGGKSEIRNPKSEMAALGACGITPGTRAQDVDLAHYISLANQLATSRGNP